MGALAQWGLLAEDKASTLKRGQLGQKKWFGWLSAISQL